MNDDTVKDVLLVDDDSSLRELLSLQLEEAGFKPQQAADGIEGLMKLRDELPKVIISDLQMPRMAGAEFISVVRRRFPSIPVIVLSGSIPLEIPAEVRPELCFEKTAQKIPALLQAVRELAEMRPDRASQPQIVSIPVRTRTNGTGYLVLTCAECLRLFQVASTPENKTEERSAICTHCEARVPFLIESAEPA